MRATPQCRRSRHISPLPPGRQAGRRGFTIIEALIAMFVLMIFAVSSTMALNLFDERAARNRNSEAARVIVDDYVNYLLNDSIPAPAATIAGTDLDGDGASDGVQCTAIASRAIPAVVPLIVARNAAATPVVSGTLYWRVQAVGKTYGCAADTDLVQVDFLFQYTYRNKTFYYKTLTFKANT